MTDGREPIRSYQRIFRPERRIYQLEGRTLPVPGGVPLRWLAYALAALVAVIATTAGSGAIAAALALSAAGAGFFIGGRSAAAAAGAGALAAYWGGGVLLGLLDWPLRFVVAPIAVATLATQATPDGRRADRFALSWLAVRLAPRRRSLGRGLPAAGVPQLGSGALWVAADERGPRLRRARVRGAATVAFASEMRVVRRGIRQSRLVARPPRRRPGRGEMATRRLAVGEGELLEVRP